MRVSETSGMWTSDSVVRSSVLEVEAHVADSGWDQPPRLYALVPTSELIAAEPALAATLGLDLHSAAGTLTPIEQDEVPADRPLETLLQEILWPPQVVGCAAVMERVMLPGSAESDLPESANAQAQAAAEHPLRQDVRIAAAATRDGRGHCAVRVRARDGDGADNDLLDGPTLVPGLLTLLARSLED